MYKKLAFNYKFRHAQGRWELLYILRITIGWLLSHYILMSYPHHSTLGYYSDTYDMESLGGNPYAKFYKKMDAHSSRPN